MNGIVVKKITFYVMMSLEIQKHKAKWLNADEWN